MVSALLHRRFRPRRPTLFQHQVTHRLDDLAELRRQTLRLFAGAGFLTALGILGYLATGRLDDELSLLVVVAIVLATASAAYRLAERAPRLATGLFLAGLTTTTVLAAALVQPVVAVAGGLVALTAVFLAGGRGGLLIALTLTLLIHHLALPAPMELAAIVLVWACGALTWLGTRAFHTVIDWEQHSAELARTRTEEARLRQAELAQMSQSLRDAYEQMQRTNAELARARAAAEEAHHLKVEFATTVSHELRTPLNLIIGFSELMVLNPQTYGDATLPAVYRGDVEAIYRNACHLSNLIDDVLDLSQVDARRMALELEPVALRAVIAEALAAVHGLFADKRLRLSVDCPTSLPVLTLDPVRIRQVLINLLANAARFTDDGGVAIRVRTVEQSVEVAVADSGCGMTEEDMRDIFSEFHRPRARQLRHTSGLGLAICKRLVELHGGRIWVESTLGSGTTFRFILPLVALDTTAGSARWETWARARPGQPYPTLAVVTDDPDVARTLRRHLDRCRTLEAISVEAAIQLADAHEVQAILLTAPGDLDVGAARARAAGLAIPIFACQFTTNHAAGRALGAAAYLPKPVTQAALHAALTALRQPLHTVLVIDDDPEMTRLLTRMLDAEAAPPAVRTASGGREGLAALERERFDAILLDLLMPDLDGYTVLKQLQADERLRPIPVIIISAKGDDADRVVTQQLLIRRPEALPVDEALRCLEASLRALLMAPEDST